MNKGEIIIYETKDGETSIDVRMEEETVWLTLNQMCFLFDRDKSVISRHIKNIFKEKELEILLNNIDEGGIARGTIGQDIHSLINIIPDRIELMKKIILNNKTPDQSRSYAGLLLINEFQNYDLERAKNFAQSMMSNFPKSENYRQFEMIKEMLENDEYINLY